jgi:hypothetical protein
MTGGSTAVRLREIELSPILMVAIINVLISNTIKPIKRNFTPDGIPLIPLSVVMKVQENDGHAAQ